MPFKPLTLEDRPVFLDFENRYPLYTSDFNFTNMFIWQGFYHFTWKEKAGCLCLMANPESGRNFCLPPLGGGDLLAATEFLFSQMDHPFMSRVPENIAQRIASAHPNWQVTADPDNDDYVYLAEKLITLSGRRMHQKKNHYNYFIQNYNFELIPVSLAIRDELIGVEAQWLTSKTEKVGQDSHLIMEQDAVHLLLKHMEELDQKGLALKIDGHIEAFTLGENLNSDTAIIHVEKGSPDFRGIYVALCSNFCRLYFADKTFINREQDLGLPGLKQSKESLKPDHMRKKFMVEPR